MTTTTRNLSITEAERDVLIEATHLMSGMDSSSYDREQLDAIQPLTQRLAEMNFERHDFNENERALLGAGGGRINAVKAFRARTGTSLKEAVEASERVRPMHRGTR